MVSKAISGVGDESSTGDASKAVDEFADCLLSGESLTEILITNRTNSTSKVTAMLFLSRDPNFEIALGLTLGPSGSRENGAGVGTGAVDVPVSTAIDGGAATFPSGRGGAATNNGCTFFNENKMGVFPQSRARLVGLFLVGISFVMGRFLSIQLVNAVLWRGYGTVSGSS
ncbi:hypothetical protein SH467x_000643 [Pirellulaceae bacterium SH467]|jgi:hypothetical protein